MLIENTAYGLALFDPRASRQAATVLSVLGSASMFKKSFKVRRRVLPQSR